MNLICTLLHIIIYTLPSSTSFILNNFNCNDPVTYLSTATRRILTIIHGKFHPSLDKSIHPKGETALPISFYRPIVDPGNY